MRQHLQKHIQGSIRCFKVDRFNVDAWLSSNQKTCREAVFLSYHIETRDWLTHNITCRPEQLNKNCQECADLCKRRDGISPIATRSQIRYQSKHAFLCLGSRIRLTQLHRQIAGDFSHQ